MHINLVGLRTLYIEEEEEESTIVHIKQSENS